MRMRQVTIEERKKIAYTCFGGALTIYIALSLLAGVMYLGLLPYIICMGATGCLVMELIFSFTPARQKKDDQ